jgi:hypothetical protein
MIIPTAFQQIPKTHPKKKWKERNGKLKTQQEKKRQKSENQKYKKMAIYLW